MKHRIQLFVFVFLSFALLPLTSYANDEPPGVKALLDSVAKQYQGMGSERPTYGSIDLDGSGGATLNDVQWSLKQPEVEGKFKISKVVISGVSQRASGAYSFKSISSENITMTMDLPDVGPMVISIPLATSSNIHILPEQSADGMDYSAFLGVAVYETSSVPLIRLTIAGQSFDAKNFTTKWQGDPETGFGKWDISLQNVVVPVSAFPEEDFKRDMKEEFGIEQFDLALDASAAVSGQDKKLNIAYGLRFTGKQIGDFEFAFAGQDIPGELAAVLKDLQSGKEPNMGQLMPLIIGIKFAKLKLRFVDNDFTAKMLKFAAKKEGTTVEEMTANGAAMIQLGLMQLNLPEFSKSVVGAYNAFVKDPQNISFEASPETPVAIATLMGLMAAPSMAIKTLGVKIEANK